MFVINPLCEVRAGAKSVHPCRFTSIDFSALAKFDSLKVTQLIAYYVATFA